MRVQRNMLFRLVFVFALGNANDSAVARDPFVVDGDRGDWPLSKALDSIFDVVPDTNRSIDILTYSIVEDHTGVAFRQGREFYFLLRFLEPPFQDTTATSVEFFFDVGADTTFGEAAPPWVDFLPDYRIEIVGKNGDLIKEFYRRFDGTQWVVSEGEDLPEVEAAHSGQYFEGAIPWAALGNPGGTQEEKERGFFYFWWTIKTTQGGSHDYAPDGDNLQTPWGPRGGYIGTVVESGSWGRIKRDAQSEEELEWPLSVRDGSWPSPKRARETPNPPEGSSSPLQHRVEVQALVDAKTGPGQAVPRVVPLDPPQ